MTTGFSILRLSDGEDIQGWVQGIVARWEKQRGPIPNTELLPRKLDGAAEVARELETKAGMFQKIKG